MQGQRILFLTGKLAEPALRRQVEQLQKELNFHAEIVVLPISVAGLLTAEWTARHLQQKVAADRAIVPGLCRGDLQPITQILGIPVERGPKDLRDLPEFFGQAAGHQRPTDYGPSSIEIIAEINHAPRLDLAEILRIARDYRESGADVIDLGCEPGGGWRGAGETVHALRAEGFRVSIDSFDPAEVEAAAAAGAELVLSVNSHNAARAVGWYEQYGAAVVAIPDTPDDLPSLERTAAFLAKHGVPHRLDPILEPIGLGFAASLGRYIACRQGHPQAAMLMGVGNLTEMTDADSAGVNVLLAGFCQELGIGSVLTTQVGNWCRSAVREFDLARRLVHYAVSHRVPAKKLEPDLLMLRDAKVRSHGDLSELAARMTDPNYRIFVEAGEVHIMNGRMHLRGKQPFRLFKELMQRDPGIKADHAFYLGYEVAKAMTAMTLGKDYIQDRALCWGFLTIPEVEHGRMGD